MNFSVTRQRKCDDNLNGYSCKHWVKKYKTSVLAKGYNQIEGTSTQMFLFTCAEYSCCIAVNHSSLRRACLTDVGSDGITGDNRTLGLKMLFFYIVRIEWILSEKGEDGWQSRSTVTEISSGLKRDWT